MKYNILGKISYSNIPEYIGCFLEISEMNYDRLKLYMAKILKDEDFESHLNDFSYHLIEEEVILEGITKDPIGNDMSVPSKYKSGKTWTLIIYYKLDINWSFILYYDSKYPAMIPVSIFIKEILKKEIDNNV
jgi:hypothetical protein